MALCWTIHCVANKKLIWHCNHVPFIGIGKQNEFERKHEKKMHIKISTSRSFSTRWRRTFLLVHFIRSCIRPVHSFQFALWCFWHQWVSLALSYISNAKCWMPNADVRELSTGKIWQSFERKKKSKVCAGIRQKQWTATSERTKEEMRKIEKEGKSWIEVTEAKWWRYLWFLWDMIANDWVSATSTYKWLNQGQSSYL